MKTLTIIDQDTSDEFVLYDNGDETILRDFEGFEYPEVKSVIEDVAGKKSAVHVANKFGRRRFSIAGDIVGSDVFQTRRDLLALLRQTGNMKLIKMLTYDDLELQVEADITKVVAPYNHKIQSFLIEMAAPDWRFYSQTERKYKSAAASQIMQNDGTERTEPVFRIDGAFTSAQLTNLSNSETFTIEYGIYGVEAGDYVEVDCFNRTVMLNGVTSIYSAFDGEFFSILPGSNTISFVVAGGDANTLLTTTYRDAYNGI